ncbi:MAG: Pr6Pr family membrane protein [Candidatus Devosia euplotis]|nr:Pr6Pr family membrane protein [Candidatus Devosia euplotis]
MLTQLGLLSGAGGLVLQFTLLMMGSRRDLPGTLGHFFAFYTILGNIALVLIYLSEALPTTRLDLFRNPLVRDMMLANIALVVLYVFFVLCFVNPLDGLFLLADYLLHYFNPFIYALWRLTTVPHGRLRWARPPLMLAPTLVYFLYILARGAWVQEYPYPVLNVVEFGYAQVLLNAAAVRAPARMVGAMVSRGA